MADPASTSWGQKELRWSRRSNRAVDKDDAGLYSTRAIAMHVGVKPSQVLQWARSGVIEPVKRGSPGCPYRFRLDDATLAQLHAEKEKMVARRAAASGTVPPTASSSS